MVLDSAAMQIERFPRDREFIKRGYGVIYLAREGCAAPFARRFQELVSDHVDLKFMDRLVLGGKIVA